MPCCTNDSADNARVLLHVQRNDDSGLRAQSDEKLVQLLELVGYPTLHPADGTVESFLRGIE
jgi:hypothetical protein